MIVMIKSAPDTPDGTRGLTLAKDGGADIVLLQNGVTFIHQDSLGPFSGTVYVLDDDRKLRGLKDPPADPRMKTIDYDMLTDIITGDRKVVGMF